MAYCNDPANAERKAHGMPAPLGVRHWQIGNETSYDRNGFNLETAAREDGRVRQGDARRRSGDSTDRLGRQRLGGAHGGSGRASTCSTWRSITCSIPTMRASLCCAASSTGAIPTRHGTS